MSSAAFIGLGSMGSHMAKNLLKNKIDLYVYNRSKDKEAPLIKDGAKSLASPSEALQKAPIVFSIVSNDQALKDIVLGDKGILANAKPGTVHISMSTVSPDLIKELAEAHKAKGVLFASGTVFGRPEAAAQGKLWVCLAGDPKAKKDAEPLLKFIGQKTYDFGDEAEKANVVKIMGNFMILSVVELLSEGFSFAEKNGIESKAVYNFLIDSMFPAPVFQKYGQVVADREFEPAGFKLELGLKDIDLLLRRADKVHVPMPLAGILHDRLMTAMALDRGKMDWATIAKSQFENSGLKK
jgi:3-hydroxyisobutyrate dehydrogenase-like beta-hydroxyacid dehydrogenase